MPRPNIVAQWTALYDAHTEIACLMLGSMTPELHRQFELHYPYDMIQELRSMFEKQAGVEKFDLIQFFSSLQTRGGLNQLRNFVLMMKGYVEQLERLGYMLPQDISVGLILNGLTKDFVGFVRNYNMHNMGKTIGEIHAMLIEYEKGLPKKAETPQVMMIKVVKFRKANKKSRFNAKGKNKRRGSQSCSASYIGDLGLRQEAENKSSLLVPWDMNLCSCTISVSRLVDNGFVQCFTDYGISVSKNGVLYFNDVPRNAATRWAVKSTLTPPYTPQHNGVSERRNRTLLDMVRSMMNLTTLPLSFWDYALESATRILNMVPTKKVDKTPYELWYGKVPNLSYLKVWGCEALVKRDTPDNYGKRYYAEFFEKRLISQEISGRAVDLEEIQEEEDTTPSEITSNIPISVEVWNHHKEDCDYEFVGEPEGFVDPNHPRKVCKLQRSIYGLKQASRSWNKRFDGEIKKFGFAQNLDEKPMCISKG
ncbi:retrotransposon protein, putative, ty1-copia subclass [Tanacetum coccineum]|uniref:Retrotransposon protein, putative, ty1-copia subclass n=1 Tax=Tanacetum coccineum TaxID=301880 RepID=A0ABQ4YHC1_9ASTR